MIYFIDHPLERKQQFQLKKVEGVGWAIYDKKSGDRVSDIHRSKNDADYILRDYKREAEEGQVKTKKDGITIH